MQAKFILERTSISADVQMLVLPDEDDTYTWSDYFENYSPQCIPMNKRCKNLDKEVELFYGLDKNAFLLPIGTEDDYTSSPGALLQLTKAVCGHNLTISISSVTVRKMFQNGPGLSEEISFNSNNCSQLPSIHLVSKALFPTVGIYEMLLSGTLTETQKEKTNITIGKAFCMSGTYGISQHPSIIFSKKKLRLRAFQLAAPSSSADNSSNINFPDILNTVSWFWKRAEYWFKVVTYNFQTKSITYGPGFRPVMMDVARIKYFRNGFELILFNMPAVEGLYFGCMLTFNSATNADQSGRLIDEPKYIFSETRVPICIYKDPSQMIIKIDEMTFKQDVTKPYKKITVLSVLGRLSLSVSCIQTRRFFGCTKPIDLSSEFTITTFLQTTKSNETSRIEMSEIDENADVIRTVEHINLTNKSWHEAQLVCLAELTKTEKQITDSYTTLRSPIIQLHLPIYRFHLFVDGKSVEAGATIEYQSNLQLVCELETNLGAFSLTMFIAKDLGGPAKLPNAFSADWDAVLEGTIHGEYNKSDPGKPVYLTTTFIDKSFQLPFVATCSIEQPTTSIHNYPLDVRLLLILLQFFKYTISYFARQNRAFCQCMLDYQTLIVIEDFYSLNHRT